MIASPAFPVSSAVLARRRIVRMPSMVQAGIDAVSLFGSTLDCGDVSGIFTEVRGGEAHPQRGQRSAQIKSVWMFNVGIMLRCITLRRVDERVPVIVRPANHDTDAVQRWTLSLPSCEWFLECSGRWCVHWRDSPAPGMVIDFTRIGRPALLSRRFTRKTDVEGFVHGCTFRRN